MEKELKKNISKNTRMFLLLFSFLVLVFSTWQFYLWNKPKQSITGSCLELPLTLRNGGRYDSSFKVKLDAMHEIEILFERSIPVNRLDSIVGSALKPDKNNQRYIYLPISVSLSDQHKQILKVDSVNNRSLSYTNQHFGRTVDVFPGEKNKQYLISIEIKKSLPDLDITHPKIVVSPVGSAIKSEMVNYQIDALIHRDLFFVSAGVFLLLTLINISWYFLARIKKYKQ